MQIRTDPSRDAPAPQTRWCLFLDVDGTLLEIAPTPDAVQVEESLKKLLLRVRDALDGAIALVSGRSLEQLDELFAPERWPAAGLHGLERRGADERIQYAGPHAPVLAGARVALADLARRSPGTLVEDKGRSLEQTAGRINGRFAETDWTPMRDGMNLVAKEFTAAQDPDDPGVLVLSTLVGAAEELSSALLVSARDTGNSLPCCAATTSTPGTRASSMRCRPACDRRSSSRRAFRRTCGRASGRRRPAGRHRTQPRAGADSASARAARRPEPPARRPVR